MQATDRTAIVNKCLTAIDGKTSLERLLAAQDDFDESKIKRDEGGQFTATGKKADPDKPSSKSLTETAREINKETANGKGAGISTGENVTFKNGGKTISGVVHGRNGDLVKIVDPKTEETYTVHQGSVEQRTSPPGSGESSSQEQTPNTKPKTAKELTREMIARAKAKNGGKLGGGGEVDPRKFRRL